MNLRPPHPSYRPKHLREQNFKKTNAKQEENSFAMLLFLACMMSSCSEGGIDV